MKKQVLLCLVCVVAVGTTIGCSSGTSTQAPAPTTPSATPNIQATVSAAVEATIAAMPTNTPIHTATSTPANTPTAQAGSATVSPTAIEKTASRCGVAITVHWLLDPWQSTGYAFFVPTGSRRVVLEVTVANRGDLELNLSSTSFELVDDRSSGYNPDLVFGATPTLPSVTLRAQEERTGRVTFILPSDRIPQTLHYDSFSSSLSCYDSKAGTITVLLFVPLR